jgi:predicted RNA-binding protein YlxR (DUF448 family)
MGRGHNLSSPLSTVAKMTRTCIACGVKDEKRSLCRFVWKGEKPREDLRQVEKGRGAYCCRRPSCRMDLIEKTGRWKRAFRLK